MSFGKLAQHFIELLTSAPVKDAEGFATPGDTVLANVRAYREDKNSTEKWANRAVFAEASALFRFRAIPGLTVDTTMSIICAGRRYNILSAEDVRGRGRYVEVVAKAVDGGG